MSVSIVATINPSAENKATAREVFNKLAFEVQEKEPGCTAFRVFNNEDGSMIIYKNYKDLDAWKTHRAQSWTQKALADGATEPTIYVFDSSMVVGFGPHAQDDHLMSSPEAISIVAIIKPSEKNRTAAHEAFNGLAAIVQEHEPECLAFRVFNHEDGSMIIYKSYKTMDAWKTHRASAWTQKALLDGKTEPLINVYSSVSTTGFGPRVESMTVDAGQTSDSKQAAVFTTVAEVVPA